MVEEVFECILLKFIGDRRRSGAEQLTRRGTRL